MLVDDVLIVQRLLTKVFTRTIAPLIYLEPIVVATQEVLLPFFKSVRSRNLVVRVKLISFEDGLTRLAYDVSKLVN
jgi:hypothetical protein